MQRGAQALLPFKGAVKKKKSVAPRSLIISTAHVVCSFLSNDICWKDILAVFV